MWSVVTHRFHQAVSAAPLLQVMAAQPRWNLQERGGTCWPIRALLGVPEAPVNQSRSAAGAGRGLDQRGVGWRRGRRRDPWADGASRREPGSTRFLTGRRFHLWSRENKWSCCEMLENQHLQFQYFTYICDMSLHCVQPNVCLLNRPFTPKAEMWHFYKCFLFQ